MQGRRATMSETKNHIAKGSGAGQPGLEATLSVNRNAFLGFLGRVDKRDSQLPLGMIQAGICDGDQLGTRPDVGRGMGVL